MEICKTNNWLNHNQMTKFEEAEFYEENLRKIYENPRIWLDKLDYLQEYRVSWKSYTKNNTPTMPKRFTKPKDL